MLLSSRYSYLTDPPHKVVGLNTIASSPLDNAPLHFDTTKLSPDQDDFRRESLKEERKIDDRKSEEMFDLELNSELDLELIEKD